MWLAVKVSLEVHLPRDLVVVVPVGPNDACPDKVRNVNERDGGWQGAANLIVELYIKIGMRPSRLVYI